MRPNPTLLNYYNIQQYSTKSFGQKLGFRLMNVRTHPDLFFYNFVLFLAILGHLVM